MFVFFFKQKTAYEMRISDWSSDVCSSDLASFAQARGVPVVAITDSVLSPLAKLAVSTIVVPTESPSFLHSMSPAFVVAEILGALVAGRGGKAALEALARVGHQMAALNVFFTPGAPPGSQSSSKARPHSFTFAYLQAGNP